jgi:hypothetical protein
MLLMPPEALNFNLLSVGYGLMISISKFSFLQEKINILNIR